MSLTQHTEKVVRNLVCSLSKDWMLQTCHA